MPNYRRPDLTGGTFFITQVTYQRYPWLCKDLGRLGLREAIEYVREKYPLKREEGNLWQRRFWEHCIRDEEDFEKHCDYIHYNPVKHGLCDSPKDWKFSSFSRFVV